MPLARPRGRRTDAARGLSRWLAGILVALAALPLVAVAQEQTIQLVGQIGGTCKAVEVVGNRAYIGEGVYLTVLDISDPTSPSRMGRIRLPDFVGDICVSSNTAYVATSGAGLQIVDVSNPSSPTVHASRRDISRPISVSGDLLLSRRSRGFAVYDISNRWSPTLRSSYSTSGGVSDVFLAGRRAYISESNGLRIFDLSDPSSPSLLGSYPQWGNALWVVGTTAYLVDGHRLFAVDVSDPSSPVLQGSVPTREGYYIVTNGLFVSGTTVYTTWQDFSHLSNDLPERGGLQITDATSPTQLTLLSNFDALGPSFGLSARAGFVYVADGYAGLTVIDARSPMQPYSLGARGNPGAAYGVFLSDNLAFLRNYGLRILDVTDPSSPALRGSYSMEDPVEDPVFGLFVSGNLAYLTSYRWLRILDVIDPTSPTLRGSLLFDGNWQPALVLFPVVVGDVLYAVGYFAGLAVIDASDPSSPTVLALSPYEPLYYDIRFMGLSVSDGLAYVAWSEGHGYTGGVDILDVSDPSSPVLLRSYDTRKPARDVCISGDLAFVIRYDYAGSYSGLLVLDVSSPSSPTQIGFFEGEYNTVAVSGNVAYLTYSNVYRYPSNYITQLRVVEISDPYQPRLRGFYELPSWCGKVYASQNLVYAPAGDAGLWILRYTPMPPPAPSSLHADALSWNQIYLWWGDRSQYEDGFSIERKVGADGQWQPLAMIGPYQPYLWPMSWRPPDRPPPPPHYYDTETSPAVTYYYRVRAYNTAGYSDYSNVTSATIAYDIPNAPTNAYGDYGPWTLYWNDNAENEQGFRIYWREDGTTSWSLAASPGPNAESLVIEYLLPYASDITNHFRVGAFNPVGESAPSNEAWFTSPTAAPAAPIGLRATPVGPYQVYLTWQDRSSNEQAFGIYRRVGTLGGLSYIGEATTNETTFQDSAVEPDTLYCYAVRAWNSKGYSDWSNYYYVRTPELLAADPRWRLYR